MNSQKRGYWTFVLYCTYTLQKYQYGTKLFDFVVSVEGPLTWAAAGRWGRTRPPRPHYCYRSWCLRQGSHPPGRKEATVSQLLRTLLCPNFTQNARWRAPDANRQASTRGWSTTSRQRRLRNASTGGAGVTASSSSKLQQQQSVVVLFIVVIVVLLYWKFRQYAHLKKKPTGIGTV